MRLISVHYFACLLCAALSLSACSLKGVAESVTPYRMDVRQGNYIDEQMVARLQEGMTQDQVRYTLGTPLLVDLFRHNRWDYLYRVAPGKGKPQQRRLSLLFKEGRLVSIDRSAWSAADNEEEDTLLQERPHENRIVEVPAVEEK